MPVSGLFHCVLRIPLSIPARLVSCLFRLCRISRPNFSSLFCGHVSRSRTPGVSLDYVRHLHGLPRRNNVVPARPASRYALLSLHFARRRHRRDFCQLACAAHLPGAMGIPVDDRHDRNASSSHRSARCKFLVAPIPSLDALGIFVHGHTPDSNFVTWP